MKCRHCSFEYKSHPNRIQCPSCRQMNIEPVKTVSQANGGSGDGTILLSNVSEKDVKVYQTGPWDKNFSDPPGVPDDAVILIGGEPGVGKSTSALQLTSALAVSQNRETLYIPAEEGDTQVKARAIRLMLPRLDLMRIISRDQIHDVSVEELIRKYKPCGAIVDSMPGFTDDLKEAVSICEGFTDIAKANRVPIFIIDHITKDGDLAGLKELEHKVDICCLMTKTKPNEIIEVYRADDKKQRVFEIEEMRELYTRKSRYGPAGSEVTTYYMMTSKDSKPPGSLVQVIPYEEEEEDS